MVSNAVGRSDGGRGETGRSCGTRSGESRSGEGRSGGASTGPSPDPVSSLDSARDGELQELAHRLFEEGERMMRLKPMPQVHDSVRGLPAVVRTLARAKGPLSPGDLARASQVTDARIANVLKVLEARGYIERRPSTADRRRVEVVLTEKGREQERARAKEGLRFMTEFLGELGVDDARDLVRLLSRINEVMEQRRAEGRAVHPGCEDISKGGRA